MLGVCGGGATSRAVAYFRVYTDKLARKLEKECFLGVTEDLGGKCMRT